ncbi:MAG: LPS assembly lipoprotein LptE [Caulobacteraceae bacterium]|nr:LPS assembly lipoprotein LptE [Caulobacteraceae bacterium]
MTGPRLRWIAPAAALILAGALSGCGFTPLYGQPGVTGGMSSVEVHAPHGRAAFLLAQDLEDALARDKSSPPAYRLDIQVNESRYSRGLQSNGVATRFESHLTVSYSLVALSSHKVVKTGVEPVEVSYANSDQPYAGITAQQNAQERAASVAADRIRLDLATYFAAHSAR